MIFIIHDFYMLQQAPTAHTLYTLCTTPHPSTRSTPNSCRFSYTTLQRVNVFADPANVLYIISNELPGFHLTRPIALLVLSCFTNELSGPSGPKSFTSSTNELFLVVRAHLVLRVCSLRPTTDARLLGENFIMEISRRMLDSSVIRPYPPRVGFLKLSDSGMSNWIVGTL